MKTITISGEDLDHGLITAMPSHVLPYGAAEFTQNIDFGRKHARICKRKGIQVEQAELIVGGVTKVCGYHQYIKSDGTKINLVAAGNRIYSVAGGVYTQRYLGTINNANVNFVTFQNLCYAVCENEPLLVWDGTAASFSTALGSPPANGKYIAVWQNRLWIFNSATGRSRLNYSVDGNGQDWLTPGSAGYIDVNIDDGDFGTGIFPLGTSLYVFKNRTIYRTVGTTPSTYIPGPVINGRGCVAPRSLVAAGGFLIYMSQYGIHSIAPDTDGFLSENIQPDIENLSSTVKLTACGGFVNDSYILSYDSDSDGKNDKAYSLDLRKGAWGWYTNVKANVFCTQDDGALLSGGSEKIIVRRHDSGEDDEGVAIEGIWRSQKLGFDDFTAMKRMYDAFWNAKPLAGKNLTMRLRVDGVQVDSSSDALDPHQTSATDEDIKIIGKDGLSMYGRFLQVEFYNNELNAPVEISEFSVSGDLDPRAQTPT